MLIPTADLDLLSLLRRQTLAAHERLDAAVDFRAPGAVTRARYAAFLRGTAGVVMPLEPVLAGWLPSLPRAVRTPRLCADLAALGEPRPAPRASLPMPRTLAEAYGCAYVVEGSALGGVVLASMVARDLGSDAPVSYLTLRGSATKPAWQSFLRDLAVFGAGSSGRDHEASARIAVQTFAAYAASLVQHGLLPETA